MTVTLFHERFGPELHGYLFRRHSVEHLHARNT